MNIHRGKKKMQVSMRDTIPGNPNFHSMSAPLIGNKRKKPSLPDRTKEQLEQRSRDKILYNTNIHNINPVYGELEPPQGFIVRMFVKEDKVTEGGIILKPDSTDNIDMQRKAGSGDRYTQKTETDPFNFKNKCIIVTTFGSMAQHFPVGSIWACEKIQVNGRIMESGSSRFMHSHWFAHPDADLDYPSFNLNHPDFGYALVVTDFFKSRLRKDESPEVQKWVDNMMKAREEALVEKNKLDRAEKIRLKKEKIKLDFEMKKELEEYKNSLK